MSCQINHKKLLVLSFILTMVFVALLSSSMGAYQCLHEHDISSSFGYFSLSVNFILTAVLITIKVNIKDEPADTPTPKPIV